ncbi:hypothetical protein PZQ95_03350, partial [Aliarcobacter butzleri]
YQASKVTTSKFPIIPAVAISVAPKFLLIVWIALRVAIASPEVSKFVWLKYAPANETGPTVVIAKIPVPDCSPPSESIATVQGVVNPCLPAVIVVFLIPVNAKFA